MVECRSLEVLSPLERWLFAKTENWILLLLLTAVLAGAVLFGGVVKHTAEGGRRAGIVGTAATAIAGLPQDALDVFRLFLAPSPFTAEEQRFDDRAGLFFPVGATWRDPGYLLLSRHDGDRQVSVVELIDLSRGETVHEWRPDPDASDALANLERAGSVDRRERMIPYALDDGSLLFRGLDGHLVMLDGCSNVEWVLETPRFHHSIERDADGHFWVPYRVDPPLVPDVAPEFVEHGLARISLAGEILSLVPLSRPLIAGGHGHLLYAMDRHLVDPMHMNDIEPVLEDGPAWRRGDLFVSLLTRSVVLLYRPSSDEVVWIASGPWLHQHDVNIVGPAEVSIFSNNAARLGHGRYGVLGANEVYLHDLASGASRSPWRDALRRHEVRTATEGRGTVLANGDVFVEETDHGRALRVGADGTLRWSYVNRSGDGQVYRLAWSRYLDAEEGARVAAAVESLTCGLV